MKTRFASALCSLLAIGALRADVPANLTFDRYQVILDRKPFGNLPPPPEPTPPPQPQAESFAKSLRLSTIIELNDGTMKIGFIDTRTNKNYLMAPGETMDGIKVVSGSWAHEEAVLEQGNELALIKLASGTVESITQADQQRRAQEQATARPDYAARRRARVQEPPPPLPEPKLTGAELQKHLEDYQLEVIRQGLPPLPIPLTPEMDQKLVQEGILPPQ